MGNILGDTMTDKQQVESVIIESYEQHFHYRWRYRADRSYGMDGILLYARGKGTTDNNSVMASGVIARQFDPEKAYTTGSFAPLLYLDMAEAQEIIDELWRCGVRPTDGAGSAGMMAAVQEHLKDLRAERDYYKQLVTDLMDMVDGPPLPR